MDNRKSTKFLRQNLILYMAGFLILLGMKYLYSKADAESLRWILGPTARWVEALSGIPFVYAPGMGYANHELRFLIAPSCSGVQFIIITAAMLFFSFSHRVGCHRVGCRRVGCRRAANIPERLLPEIPRAALGLGWLAASLFLSYLFTILVNGLRIVAAIYLPPIFERTGVLGGWLTPERLHTMRGAVVYFAALLTIYRLAGLLFDRFQGAEKDRPSASILRRCLSPVFWYFFIVLGIPFLNRAWRSGRFTEFALLVSLCCGSVLVLYGLAILFHRLLRHKG